MWLLWASLGAGLIVIETMTLEFTCLALALGCFTACVLAVSGLGVLAQCLGAAAMAVIGVFVLAPVLRLRLTPKDTPTGLDLLIGAEAEVIEAIAPPAHGKVRLDGVTWQASSQLPVPAGARVIITDLDGNRLNVLAHEEFSPRRIPSAPPVQAEKPAPTPEEAP